jgi:uncharacterized protein (TIGR00288 family)
MSFPYTRAPHQGGPGAAGQDTLHAALLIDFDNVTMGMRSDLSKELKTLLDSDVIKGKVSVQRAYADWRRYPQYIVPLSEASVDLIFAPAYGSNKKNATDIRMAIDALELVFIRPEIGTYILLTGDSDFSSLVLKLKEYGKYVIGVGIQESSSDILVQNCDEYYSYTSLTGLTKTTELQTHNRDPWVLVKDAVDKMVSRGDVMRSDRLKQVMQEIDSSFDEGSIGFSKFSKFLAEASSRGLVKLRKLENGQYEVDVGRGKNRRGPSGPDPLQAAYELLTKALGALREGGRDPVRDSDVKRKILEEKRNFDEAELGFPKFSRFLAQAAEHGIVRVSRTDSGNLEVSLVDGGGEASSPEEPAPDSPSVSVPAEPPGGAPAEASEEPEPTDAGPTVVDVLPPDDGRGRGLGPRGGSTRRRGGDAPVPIFEGQAADAVATSASPDIERSGSSTEGAVEGLGLPNDPGAIVRYLTHRYKGVGAKTAETLVDHFGTGLFATLHGDPDAIARVVPVGRAEQVLEAWRADYARRTGQNGGEGDGGSSRGNRRSGRGRS